MNQIIEVNEKLAYAVIEAGVSQGQLAEYLEEKGIALQVDATGSSPECSLTGNAIDRGMSVGPYGDHLSYIAKFEAVLPDGSVLGMNHGPIKDSKSAFVYKWGLGPEFSGVFSQFGLGIITKVCLWLHPKKDSFKAFFGTVKEDNLKKLVDTLRDLCLHKDLIPGFSILQQKRVDLLHKERANTKNSNHFIFYFGIYGDKLITAAKLKLTIKALRRLIDTKIILDYKKLKFLKKIKNLPFKLAAFDYLEGIEAAMNILAGKPNDFALRLAYSASNTPINDKGLLNPARDNCGLIWLTSVVPLDGDELLAFFECITLIHKNHSSLPAPSISFICNAQRSLVATIPFNFDKKNKQQAEEAYNFYKEVADSLLEKGYPPYRTGTFGMGRYFNGQSEIEKISQKIKKAIDPLGIISPGRYSS